MDPITIALGIASIISVLSGVYSIRSTNKQNKELAQQQNQWNAQAATTAYERGIEQWNRETDYGSQMSKLESAGINPALAYSSGVSMPSFSAVTPAHGVAPPKMQAMDFSGLQSGAQSLAQYNLQQQYTDQQVKLMRAQEKSITDANNRENNIFPDKQRLTQSQSKHLDQLSNYLSELQNVAFEDSRLKRALTANASMEYEFNMRSLDDRLKLVSNQRTISDTDVRYCEDRIKAQLNLLKNEALEAASRASTNVAQAKYYNELASYYDEVMRDFQNSLKSYYDALEGNVSSQTELNSATAGYYRERTAWIPDEIAIGAINQGIHGISVGVQSYNTIANGGKFKNPTIGKTYPKAHSSYFVPQY